MAPDFRDPPRVRSPQDQRERFQIAPTPKKTRVALAQHVSREQFFASTDRKTTLKIWRDSNAAVETLLWSRGLALLQNFARLICLKFNAITIAWNSWT